MAKVYLFLLLVSIFSGVGYAGYTYYTWSEETIATLRENNVKLKTAAETLQATVEQMVADAARNEELNKNLTRQLQQSQEHLDKLRGVFAKIDLTMEALTDAQGLEDRVNAAVEKLINRIENETSPVSDDAAAAERVRDDESAGD